MKYFKCYLLLVLVTFGCAKPERNKDLPIMGNLPIGKYEVGYTTLFTYDKTKPGIPFSDWEGRLYDGYDKSKGRQFQINVWYPAQVGSGSSMKYRDYVHLRGRQTDFTDTEENRLFGEELFAVQTDELGDDSTFTDENLQTLLDLDVLALREAKHLNEKFPVVVYPNGGSPAFQSITCEFLASHGYVIVAFVAKGRFSSGLEVSGVGLEAAVDDMEFVLGKISGLPNVNMGEVSLMANAISSSVCASTVARNEKIMALISLEGGLPSAFEQRLLNESLFYRPENLKAPILFIYAPHPSIDPKYTYHLKYADRYYAHFPNMSEYVMLNYGMFDSFIPNIIGEHEGGTQLGFEQANQLILRFLNQTREGTVSGLFDPSYKSSMTEIDTTLVLKGIPAPPNISVMKDMFIKNGFEPVDSTYQELKANNNSQPFSKSFYTSYRNWLAWKKDPDYLNRQKLYALAYDSYPESAIVNYYLAYYSMKRSLNPKAIDHYRIALNLVNEDPDLTVTERENILSNAKEELAALL